MITIDPKNILMGMFYSLIRAISAGAGRKGGFGGLTPEIALFCLQHVEQLADLPLFHTAKGK